MSAHRRLAAPIADGPGRPHDDGGDVAPPAGHAVDLPTATVTVALP